VGQVSAVAISTVVMTAGKTSSGGEIANPEKHIPNWKSLDPRQQKALIDKKWPSDIQRQTEQLEILEGLLKKTPGSGPT
jgi:hypothetical protein